MLKDGEKNKCEDDENESESDNSSESDDSSEEVFEIDIQKIKVMREKGQRSSVSAEVYGKFNQIGKYTAEVKVKDKK